MSSPVSKKSYFLVWIALLSLLLLTWGLAEINLGPFNNLAALMISVTKMMLVVLIFMHGRFEKPLTWIFMTAGVIWLLIMMDLTLSDYLTRGDVPRGGQSWKHVEKKSAHAASRPRYKMKRELMPGMNFLKLPIGEHFPEIVNAVIEVPYGCTNKYEYDKSLNLFRLDRPLYASVHYPGEYGFIPSTLSSDGDPLDIIVLVTDATFPGCLVEARPVGVLEMVDQGVPDEKILAVAKSSPTHAEIHGHKDLAPHLLREIEHFFSIYKELEGKHTEVKGWHGVEEAHRLIREGQKRFGMSEA